MRDVRTRGETPLHRAAAFGSEQSIQMLLAAGARLDAKDIHGDSPLTWASWHRTAERQIGWKNEKKPPLGNPRGGF